MIYSLGQIRSSGVLYRSPICLPLHLWQTALFYLLNASIASQNKVKVERNETAKTACRHRTKNLCPILLSSAQFTCNATAHACATDHPPNHARGMRTVHNDLLAMSPACRRLRTTIKCFQHSTIIAPGSVHAPYLPSPIAIVLLAPQASPKQSSSNGEVSPASRAAAGCRLGRRASACRPDAGAVRAVDGQAWPAVR